ncbi:MAG: hypothetical protein IPM54_01760 [Polyangiaceae bacterium]|nr:hypothetical protein [Polyangiaceae bacterium]
MLPHRVVAPLVWALGSLVGFSFGVVGCGADQQGSGAAGLGASSGASSSSTGGSGGEGTAGGGGNGGEGGIGVGGSFVGAGGAPSMVPVRKLPGLTSITFYERTGGTEPTAYTFTIDGPELGVRLADPLGDANKDISGASTEYYDVFYSNADGEFNIDGSYLTISGVFGQALPAGGGLNLAEIGLNYVDAATEYGNYVASYVVLGDNSYEPAVPACIDGDLQTHTTMGNTVGSTERLRLTLGFNSTSGVPK